MKCYCSKTPDYLYFEDAKKRFFNSLKEIETGNWIKLFQCQKCHTLWAIDEWDKYFDRVIIKVYNKKDWENNILSDDIRKKLLLESRGGTTDEVCMYADCNKKRVKGVVFCIDHLYETGARK